MSRFVPAVLVLASYQVAVNSRVRRKGIAPGMLALVDAAGLFKFYLGVFGRDGDAERIDLIVGYTRLATPFYQWLPIDSFGTA